MFHQQKSWHWSFHWIKQSWLKCNTDPCMMRVSFDFSQTVAFKVFPLGTQEAAKMLLIQPITGMTMSVLFGTLEIYNKFPMKYILIFTNWHGLEFLWPLRPCVLARQKLSLESIMVASFSIPYFFVYKWLFTLMPFCAGFLSMILNSAPFLLIEIYRKKSNYPKTRGLANDNSCVTLSCKLKLTFFGVA